MNPDWRSPDHNCDTAQCLQDEHMPDILQLTPLPAYLTSETEHPVFPEGALLQRNVELAGGQLGLIHACPHCGRGISRTDYVQAFIKLKAKIKLALEDLIW